jgi:hypothetical protein
MRFCYVQIDTNAERSQIVEGSVTEVLAGASRLNDRDGGN